MLLIYIYLMITNIVLIYDLESTTNTALNDLLNCNPKTYAQLFTLVSNKTFSTSLMNYFWGGYSLPAPYMVNLAPGIPK